MTLMRHRIQSLMGAALLVAMAGGPAHAQAPETGMATQSIYTGQAWNHTFVWPSGIERITTTGATGLTLNFRATLTSMAAGRTTEKTVCKRLIEDPVVKALGGSSMIWTFVDYDPENGVTCDLIVQDDPDNPGEKIIKKRDLNNPKDFGVDDVQLTKIVARPDLGPKTCTTTPTSIDCLSLGPVNLPDEVSYSVAFPANANNRVVILNIHLKGQSAPRQIRYVAGGCNWLTCP